MLWFRVRNSFAFVQLLQQFVFCVRSPSQRLQRIYVAEEVGFGTCEGCGMMAKPSSSSFPWVSLQKFQGPSSLHLPALLRNHLHDLSIKFTRVNLMYHKRIYHNRTRFQGRYIGLIYKCWSGARKLTDIIHGLFQHEDIFSVVSTRARSSCNLSAKDYEK